MRATRITYVGELGWELYVPTELAPAVYEDLFAPVRTSGVVPAGYYAIESMRLEKGYRAFGRELTTETGPVEAGLTFACKLRSDVDFLGRAAVEAARLAAPARRVVSLVVDDPAAYPWGGELVLRDGEPVGQVTSAAWGAPWGLGRAGAGRGPGSRARRRRTGCASGAWQVDLAGERLAVRVGLRRRSIPTGTRVGRAARTA